MNKQKIISYKSLHTSKLKETFPSGKRITVGELIDFYKKTDPEIKRSTIHWRIHELLQQKVLYRLERGVYSLSKPKKQTYYPEVSRSLKLLNTELKKRLPYLEACIWDTAWLNEFMIHQVGINYTILEVPKEFEESLLHYTLEFRNDVMMDTTAHTYFKYGFIKDDHIIIRNLITEAPTQFTQSIKTVTIEKMLVDLLCDELLFSAYQGAELIRLYHNAFEKYRVNLPKMMRYARRRNKDWQVEDILSKISNKWH